MATEKLNGNGRVLNGDTFVADVEYEVRIYGQYIKSSHLSGHGVIPAMPRLECDIFGLPRVLSSQVRFTLVMNDGRKLNFYATGHDSVKVTGGIYNP